LTCVHRPPLCAAGAAGREHDLWGCTLRREGAQMPPSRGAARSARSATAWRRASAGFGSRRGPRPAEAPRALCGSCGARGPRACRGAPSTLCKARPRPTAVWGRAPWSTRPRPRGAPRRADSLWATTAGLGVLHSRSQPPAAPCSNHGAEPTGRERERRASASRRQAAQTVRRRGRAAGEAGHDARPPAAARLASLGARGPPRCWWAARISSTGPRVLLACGQRCARAAVARHTTMSCVGATARHQAPQESPRRGALIGVCLVGVHVYAY
jgi:hypothetical protein